MFLFLKKIFQYTFWQIIKFIYYLNEILSIKPNITLTDIHYKKPGASF